MGILSGLIMLLLGVVLLYGPVSRSDTSQTGTVLAGASLVSFGFMTILLITKDWMNWKRHYKSEGGDDKRVRPRS
jgi:drug/metabolite transporter (DMT)-like permease